MRHLAYPTQFFLFVLARIIFSISGPILALVVYSKGSGIPGWTFQEFLLFNGTLILFIGIAESFFMASAWRIPRMIELGEFDKFLLRPLSMIKFLLLSGFDLDGLGNVVVGAFIIGYAILTGGFQITILAVALYMFIFLLGLIIEFCTLLLIVTLSFLFVKTGIIWNILDTIFEFTRYPLTIYGGFLQFVLTFVLPFSLSAFYPVEALLGRLNMWLLAPITGAAILFVLFSTLMFKLGLKKYTSAGG